MSNDETSAEDVTAAYARNPMSKIYPRHQHAMIDGQYKSRIIRDPAHEEPEVWKESPADLDLTGATPTANTAQAEDDGTDSAEDVTAAYAAASVAVVADYSAEELKLIENAIAGLAPAVPAVVQPRRLTAKEKRAARKVAYDAKMAAQAQRASEAANDMDENGDPLPPDTGSHNL